MKFLPTFLAGGALLCAAAAHAVEIRQTAVVAGAEPGPSLAVVVPGTEYTATHSIARQLSAFDLPRGKMTVVEYVGDSITMEEAAEAVSGASPQLTIVFSNDGEAAEDRDRLLPPTATASNPETAREWISAAIADSYAGTEEGAPQIDVTQADAESMLWVRVSGEDVPVSRRARWTRNLVFEALAAGGMAPDREQLVTVLYPGGPAYALYDAEGTTTPASERIQRVARDSGIGMEVTMVSGEDVRDGVLALGFEGVVFPGGTAMGTARGIGTEGQELVREFVEDGGGYVGICAGAYLAGARLNGFLRLAGADHLQPWAKGRGMVDVELTEEGKAILGEEFAEFSTRYVNGPIFPRESDFVPEGEFAPLVPLAHFRSATERRGEPSTEMIGEPAILVTTHGEGRVLLLSPHPETHPELDQLVRRILEWPVRRDAASAGQLSALSGG